jgi:hypothetical protein
VGAPYTPLSNCSAVSPSSNLLFFPGTFSGFWNQFCPYTEPIRHCRELTSPGSSSPPMIEGCWCIITPNTLIPMNIPTIGCLPSLTSLLLQYQLYHHIVHAPEPFLQGLLLGDPNNRTSPRYKSNSCKRHHHSLNRSLWVNPKWPLLLRHMFLGGDLETQV